MMDTLQLQATFATLHSVRAIRRSPIELLRILAVQPGTKASVTVEAIGEDLDVTFCFPDLQRSWSTELVRSCLIPMVFAYTSVRFVEAGFAYELDATQFDKGCGLSTMAKVRQVGPSATEFLSVRLDNLGQARSLLSSQDIERYLLRNTWIGVPRTPRIDAVDIKILARQQTIRTRRYATEAQGIFVDSNKSGQRAVAKAFIYGSDSGAKGEVWHTALGSVGPTTEFCRVADGIAVDVVFSVEPASGAPFEVRGPAEKQEAASVIREAIERALKSPVAKQIIATERNRTTEAALARLEQRRAQLKTADFVSWKGKVMYRKPRNENDLVCLFMKLLGSGAIPFECQVFEYTAKRGIDAIGHFRLHQSSVRELYAPIEFEHMFESFISHGHPPEQAKLIICWDAEETDEAELQETDRPWHMRYVVGEIQIPVVLVSRFPEIRIEEVNHA